MMKTIVLLWLMAAVTIVPAAFDFTGSALGADVNTVISVSGPAWGKSDDGKWEPLASGDRLDDDGWVRTGAEGQVRLVRADGTMLVIPAKEERQIARNESPGEDEGWGIFRILSELFSDEKRKRAAASRGGGDAGEHLARRYAADWSALIQKQRLTREDLPLLFDTAAYYRERALQNRAVALLVRAEEDFPDDPGFAAMARRAREAFGQPAMMEVWKRTGEGGSQMQSGASLKSGDGVQVLYGSETESWLYLFIHSAPQSGEPFTARIVPGKNLVSQPAAQALLLPAKGKYFDLDDAVGREYIWSWSCTSPLTDAVSNAARDTVVAAIAGNGDLTSADVRNAAPALCLQGFAYAFDHR